MKLRFGSIAIAAILAEILGIFSVVLLVVMFRPADETQIRAFAELLGLVIGPPSGVLFCLVGGYWVARRARTSYRAHGLATGATAAILYIFIGMVSGAPFSWIVTSSVARIVGGAVGGLFAEKRHG
jgi:hypothetical protein